MIEDVKGAVTQTVALMKELNSQVKAGEIDIDFLLKLSTTMKVSSMKLDKIIKENKMALNGGVTKKEEVVEE
ncbi:hypothetical protein D3C81_451660 [compost metagenome]